MGGGASWGGKGSEMWDDIVGSGMRDDIVGSGMWDGCSWLRKGVRKERKSLQGWKQQNAGGESQRKSYLLHHHARD